jgi:hypothetical protein
MEIRLARLEGAYEQIDHRLADLRQEMVERFAAVDQRFVSVDQHFVAVEQRISSLELRMDQKFNWVLGLIVGTWITTILTILFHR